MGIRIRLLCNTDLHHCFFVPVLLKLVRSITVNEIGKIEIPSNCSSSEASADDSADDSAPEGWFSSGVSANISAPLQYSINYVPLIAATDAVYISVVDPDSLGSELF